MVSRGGGGSLVGVASLAALEGMPRGQHYASAKAGIIALIQSCAVELARDGIRANAIVPGWIETPLTEHTLQRESLRENVLKRIPTRRWGQPEDFAGLAVYLASSASAYHTADTFVVDGGYRVF
jgi:NAD(P)-dependent dehydrogenase (short-subunit alcohol dehydrogenase family)